MLVAKYTSWRTYELRGSIGKRYFHCQFNRGKKRTMYCTTKSNRTHKNEHNIIHRGRSARLCIPYSLINLLAGGGAAFKSFLPTTNRHSDSHSTCHKWECERARQGPSSQNNNVLPTIMRHFDIFTLEYSPGRRRSQEYRIHATFETLFGR